LEGNGKESINQKKRRGSKEEDMSLEGTKWGWLVGLCAVRQGIRGTTINIRKQRNGVSEENTCQGKARRQHTGESNEPKR
jgi:hypothetical protein